MQQIKEFTQDLAYLISGMFSFNTSIIILDTKHNPIGTIQYNAEWLITWKRKIKELERIDQYFYLKLIAFHKLFTSYM